MTREEAIELLDNLIGMVEDNHNSDYDTAFKMAIKALEQEPCGNTISRQAVKEWLWDNAIYGYDRFIDKIPSVKREPKTGHWIDGLIAKVLEEVDGGTDDTYIRYTDICNRVEKSIREYCGAKMVEPQESEDIK